ncbi:MAG: hypothetical protein D6677_09670 [Calditrichaeota bacterium]|nr:MAG: hypothetical protein D6677_09670 [Calditrichota bacterium]
MYILPIRKNIIKQYMSRYNYKKQILLIFAVTLAATLFGNWHHHDFQAGETDTCPAVMMSLTFNTDMVPDAVSLPDVHLFSTPCFAVQLVIPQDTFYIFSDRNRAPPVL